MHPFWTLAGLPVRLGADMQSPDTSMGPAGSAAHASTECKGGSRGGSAALQSTIQAQGDQNSTPLRWGPIPSWRKWRRRHRDSERDVWEKAVLVVSTVDIGGIVGTMLKSSRDLL